MPTLLYLLLTLGITLRFSYNTADGSPLPAPTPTTRHAHKPGSKVVIVVQNEPGKNHPVHPTFPSESQRKEKRASRKNILVQNGINRRGLLLARPSGDDTPLLKKGKGLIPKIFQASPRHISAVTSDVFSKSYHKGTSLGEKINGLMEFRPHQPDITADAQSGKLSLPIGFTNEGIKHISPTPMANQINPYTNGVTSSFPNGIDPYEGFIRYATENLDTPAGNLVDSLEHFYGNQHPLSPQYGRAPIKEANSLDNHPYADSFAYSGDNRGEEIGGSPPLASPPPPVATAGTNLDGFRARDNADHNGPIAGVGDGDHHNSLNPYDHGHGIDHFHAPSPGLSSAPPRPRAPEPASYEDEQQASPYPSGGPPFGHNIPYKGGPHVSFPGQPHGISNSPPPPDLRVFEEGPPPELTNQGPPRGPPSAGGPPPMPPHAHHQHHPPPQASHNGPEAEHGGDHGGEHAHATPTDGGDDAIWGILDLAEMLEKGQLPGQSPNTSASNSPAQNDRVVIPYYAGASKPAGAGPQDESASPYDYENEGSRNHLPPPHFTPLDSQEGNDYDDQYSK